MSLALLILLAVLIGAAVGYFRGATSASIFFGALGGLVLAVIVWVTYLLLSGGSL